MNGWPYRALRTRQSLCMASAAFCGRKPDFYDFFPEGGIEGFYIGSHSSKMSANGTTGFHATFDAPWVKQVHAGDKKRLRSIPLDTNEV
jgi:hypothetical protein